MWRGYEYLLCHYGIQICSEWRHRRYDDKQLDWFYEMRGHIPYNGKQPPWLGDERFHSSHRAALLAKDYAWYSQFGWEEEPGINYYWPEVAR